jgi:hypothetical protein
MMSAMIWGPAIIVTASGRMARFIALAHRPQDYGLISSTTS